MTTAEWIYGQTILTDLALDNAQTAEEREFVLRRLRELKGRVEFELRQGARERGADPFAEWSDLRMLNGE
jgi:hypothetical protein